MMTGCNAIRVVRAADLLEEFVARGATGGLESGAGLARAGSDVDFLDDAGNVTGGTQRATEVGVPGGIRAEAVVEMRGDHVEPEGAGHVQERDRIRAAGQGDDQTLVGDEPSRGAREPSDVFDEVEGAQRGAEPSASVKKKWVAAQGLEPRTRGL